MAIQNRTITISGVDAKLVGVSIAPQYKPDGTVDHIVLAAVGLTKDSAGKELELERLQVKFQPGQMATVDNLLAMALTELRKSNGLET